MAKKAKKSPAKKQPVNLLPQNILPVGERVEENKNIYISQDVYKQIHRFTKNKTTDESGGMLIGTVIEEFGKMNVVISGFVEAKFSEGTPTTLKFTHETWEYVHKEIEKKHKGKKILGWIHTHPNFGIFLSEYDKFIHQNFFSEEHQIAYVVDPIQKLEGFYFWINGNLERCKGFYIFDKPGTRITVNVAKEEPVSEEKRSRFDLKSILIAILSVAVVFLLFSNISMNKQIQQLEQQQSGTNQVLMIIDQLLGQQQMDVQEIIDILTEKGIIEEPEVPEATPEAGSNEEGETENE